MGYQGTRRTGSATGAHRQASWLPSDDPGYSAQAAMGRTPARGFPPVNPAPAGLPGRDQPSLAPEATGAWQAPGAPFAGPDETYAAGYGYQEGDDDQPRPGEPVAAARAAAGTRRRDARPARIKGPGRRPRTAWLAMAAVAVLAAGGLAAYKYLYEPRVNAPVPSSLRLPTTAVGSPDFVKALGKWQHIGTRAEDPAPLTLTELYPPRFALNGSSYVRAAASVTNDCTLAVYGARLQAALQSGHCTQVLRASYVSGTMMGTIGVANLSTASEAQKAGQATGPEEIIAPLSAQKGPTSKLGTGTGVVQAEIKGHYLILMWAEFTSLKSPSTAAQRQLLEQFADNLVTGSANIDLSTRMLTGKAEPASS
jgi:hypothetical protein